MEKTTIIIGDIHGRLIWKDIVADGNFDRVVFIGDYFDTHDDISPAEQMFNFKEIIEFVKGTNKEVVMLIGNHDHHYFPEIGENGTSGYQRGAAPAISQLLDENRGFLRMAYQFENILCSHAGIGETWLEAQGWDGVQDIADFVNDVWKYKPKAFEFTGWASMTGDEVTQTPIWIRPRSLVQDTKGLREKGIIQVVGHTQQPSIDIRSGYWFIDALGTSGEYIICKRDSVSIYKVKHHNQTTQP